MATELLHSGCCVLAAVHIEGPLRVLSGFLEALLLCALCVQLWVEIAAVPPLALLPPDSVSFWLLVCLSGSHTMLQCEVTGLCLVLPAALLGVPSCSTTVGTSVCRGERGDGTQAFPPWLQLSPARNGHRVHSRFCFIVVC